MTSRDILDQINEEAAFEAGELIGSLPRSPDFTISPGGGTTPTAPPSQLPEQPEPDEADQPLVPSDFTLHRDPGTGGVFLEDPDSFAAQFQFEYQLMLERFSNQFQMPKSLIGAAIERWARDNSTTDDTGNTLLPNPEDVFAAIPDILLGIRDQALIEDEFTPFSTNPNTNLTYNKLKETISNLFGIEEDLSGSFVNAWANEWRSVHGAWPTEQQAYSDPNFIAGALSTTLGQNAPPLFYMEDAEGQLILYDNRGLFGPVPTSVQDTDLFRNQDIPTIRRADIEALIESRSGRGGGGGGGVRVQFDRDQIIEAIRNAWQNLLLDDPDNAGALADRYIREATAFAQRGGRLDLETWVLNKMRATDRFQMFYKNKPAHMSEAEYIGQYRSVVSQFGLRPGSTRRLLASGLRTGVGAAAFAERIGNTRQVSIANRGSIGRRMAETISGLAVANR